MNPESGDGPAAGIAATFSLQAAGYDAPRRRLIPCFDEFYGAALAALNFAADEAPRIVDLGAGTGLLAGLIRARLPRAELVLVDLAPGMLARARERFAGDRRVAYTVADLAAAPLPPCDACVSSLAIHHLTHAAKRDLFARIHAALVPGGVFVNADQFAAADAAADAALHTDWLATVRADGEPEGLAAALDRMQADINAPLEDQLAWLADAGFVDVEARYKRWFFCVCAGRKPE